MKPKRPLANVNKAAVTLLSGFCLIFATNCASTKPRYTEYASNEIHQGQGGAVSSEDGVEIWTDGAPMRQYRIIGTVEISPQHQKRLPVPLVGQAQKLMPRTDTDSELAKEAKSHGGDAVIIVQNQSPTPEDSFDDETDADSGSFGSHRHSRQITAYVVKYVGPMTTN
jgi:hypothetical protein